MPSRYQLLLNQPAKCCAISFLGPFLPHSSATGSTDIYCELREGSPVLGKAIEYGDSTIFFYFEESPQFVRSSLYNVSNCVNRKSLFRLF